RPELADILTIRGTLLQCPGGRAGPAALIFGQRGSGGPDGNVRPTGPPIPGRPSPPFRQTSPLLQQPSRLARFFAVGYHPPRRAAGAEPCAAMTTFTEERARA